jgi:hypothetical protein
MRKLLRSRYLWLVLVGAIWCLTIYFRAMYPVIHPWEPLWILWVFAHDLIAGCFGYQIAQINRSRDTRMKISDQAADYRRRVADFADDVGIVLKNDGDGTPPPGD